MALREVALKVGFSGGLESKADAKTVPSTKLLALENGIFARLGSIRKRNGYSALGSTVEGAPSSSPVPIRMAARGDELLEFTSNRCYSRQVDADQRSDVGAVFSVTGRERPLVRTGTQQTAPDQASLNGVTVAAWEDSRGGVWWTAIDTESGRVHRAPTQADANGISPRCVPCGTNLHIYYAVASLHRIMVLVVNPSAPSSVVVPAILTDDIDGTNTIYDACGTDRTEGVSAIAWFEHGTANIRLGYVHRSGVLGAPSNGNASIITYAANRLATSPLALAHTVVDTFSGDRFVIGYVAGATDGTVAYFTGGSITIPPAFIGGATVYTAASLSRVAIATAFVGAGRTVWSAWEEANGIPSQRTTSITSSDQLVASGVVTLIRSVGLASRAFAVGTDVFAVFVHDTTYFNTYITLKISDIATDGHVVVGRHAPAEASGAPARKHLPSAHVADDVVTIALPVRERLESENNDKFRETGIQRITLDFDDDNSHLAAQLGAGLYLPGACLSHYDGRIWAEHGFHFGPELILTANAGGGSMTPSTTYLYRAWYESTDAQGEVHPGPTSAGTLVTMAGGDTQVSLTLPMLRVTKKQNVRIMVARSLAAKTGKTAQLFRVTSLDPSAVGANGYVANDPTINAIVFIDRMSDATLENQDELYTDGGILSNDPASIGSVVAGGKSRLFATDQRDGNVVRYSQPLDSGFGVEWPPDLALSVDPVGGDITAIAARDDRVFVFKQNAILTFVGDGPEPNGNASSSGFTNPQLLPGDVGCSDPASIVLTPSGFMFKSPKGIYLLGNDGALSYVGAPAELYNTQAVRRATVMPDRTQVLFLTDSGLSLLYDYLFGQWSTFTNHEGRSAAVVGNTYHYLRTDGRVFRETAGSYSDDGSRIRLRLETAWIHMLEQLQGFQKFWYMHLLGTWATPHQLGIQYETDYLAQWTDTFWYDATGLSSNTGWITGSTAIPIGTEPITGSNYGDGQYGAGDYGGTMPALYEWRLDLNEKGQSIRFRFEDFEASGFSGASFELTEMLLTGAAMGNAQRPFTGGRGL